MMPWPPTDPTIILACTIWMECRSGGQEGMQSVANVVCNRASLPGWWGHDIASVCLAPKQFSSWNADSTQIPLVQAAMTSGDPLWPVAFDIASQAVMDRLPDITDGATMYYDTCIAPPYWSAPPAIFTIEIAGQRFFKE